MFTQLFTKSGSPPMRDPKYKIRGEPLDGRTVEYAHSVEGIDEVYQTFTRYDDMDRYTLGDIITPVIFHPRVSDSSALKTPVAAEGETVIVSAVPGGPREIPAWSYAMPAIGAETTSGGVKAFPIYDKFYSADDRFEPLGSDDISLPNEGTLVAGQVGIILGATKEDGFIEKLFLPTGGNPLIAANNDDVIPKSTLVYDLDPLEKLSELDRAPLHTVWRVIRPKFEFADRTGAGHVDPVLSWQLADPTYSRIGHGACYDYSRKFSKFITVPPLGSSGSPPPPPPESTDTTPPTPESTDPLYDSIRGTTTLADYYGFGGTEADTTTTTTTTTTRPRIKLGNVIGYSGYRLGGPLFVGEIPDKHFLGITEEGEEQFSLHLDTMTIFKRHGGHGSDYDAPLKFEGLYHRDDPLPYPKRAHIRYDPCETHPWLDTEDREGYWRVQTESEIAGSEDYDTYLANFYGTEEDPASGSGAELTDTSSGGGATVEYFMDETASEGDPERPKEKPVPRPPTCYDLLDERRKAMEKEGTTPIFDKYSNNRSDFAGQESYRFTPFAMGFNEILGKPQPTILNSVSIRDYRTSTLPVLRPYLDAYKNVMPITSRMLFYGGMTTSENEPEYTQRREDLTSRFRSGTGSGGIVLMPPEIDAADLKYQNTFGGHIPEITNSEVSQTALTLVPGVRLHYGYPNLESGSRNFGWNTTFNNTTGQLDHSLKVAAGSETTLLRYPATATATDCFDFSSDILTRNNLILKGGTGFLSTITSAPTGNNIGTIQDSSGTFAWLTDIPAGAGVWTKNSTTLFPTTAGDEVAGGTGTDECLILKSTSHATKGNIFFGSAGSPVATIYEQAGALNGTILAAGDLAIKSGTAFKGTFTSALTASDKIYTMQDASGTVAFTSDVTAVAHWERTVTDLHPTNAGDTVSFTDNVYNTGVSDTTTGFKINSGVMTFKSNGTDALELDTTHNATITNQLSWKDNTYFKGTLTHANTGDQTYTTPDRTGNVAVPDIQEFSADGTWTKPDGVTTVQVELWGSGGGGGGGRGAAAGNLRTGGSGGGGGAYNKKVYSASEVGATGAVVVGAGGAGGASNSNGTDGALSSFTPVTATTPTVYAGGGAGGDAGGAAAGVEGGGGGGIYSSGSGSTGGGPAGSIVANANDGFGGSGGAAVGARGPSGVYGGGGGGGSETNGSLGNPGGSSIFGSGAGGAGGGVTAASPGTASDGGAGGTWNKYSFGGGGTAGTSGGGAGGAGAMQQGGGGGGSRNNSTGGAGGQGGSRGGGGGGGGGGTSTGGAGGTGGDGFVRVTSW